MALKILFSFEVFCWLMCGYFALTAPKDKFNWFFVVFLGVMVMLAPFAVICGVL